MREQPRKLEAKDMWASSHDGPNGSHCAIGWVNLWWPVRQGFETERRQFIRAYRRANGSAARSIVAHNDTHCRTHQDRADAMNRALDLMPKVSDHAGWEDAA